MPKLLDESVSGKVIPSPIFALGQKIYRMRNDDVTEYIISKITYVESLKDEERGYIYRVCRLNTQGRRIDCYNITSCDNFFDSKVELIKHFLIKHDVDLREMSKQLMVAMKEKADLKMVPSCDP
jgi:hypothetical protein